MTSFAIAADRLWDGRADNARPGLAVVVKGALVEAVTNAPLLRRLQSERAVTRTPSPRRSTDWW